MILTSDPKFLGHQSTWATRCLSEKTLDRSSDGRIFHRLPLLSRWIYDGNRIARAQLGGGLVVLGGRRKVGGTKANDPKNGGLARAWPRWGFFIFQFGIGGFSVFDRWFSVSWKARIFGDNAPHLSNEKKTGERQGLENLSNCPPCRRKWYSLDISECDSSHFRGLVLFLALVVRFITKESKLLSTIFTTLICNLTSHWRLRTLKLRQKLEFWSALASGLSWTFLANTWIVLMLLAVIFEEADTLVAGGDDSVADIPCDESPNFAKAEQFIHVPPVQWPLLHNWGVVMPLSVMVANLREKKTGCLGYTSRGLYYCTQLYRDYNKPLQGSLLSNQYNGK